MPTIPFNRILLAVVGALALLFAVLEPPATRALSFPAALGFWLVHVGVGMLLAVKATAWLAGITAVATWRPWLCVLAGGALGSLLFAPFALVVDMLLPVETVIAPDDDILDRWEAGGGPLALLAEWLQLSPSYIASWLLVNAVPLAATQAPIRSAHLADSATTRADTTPAQPTPAPMAPEETPHGEHGVRPAGHSMPDDAPATAPPDAARAAFLAQLPPAIGTDLIAIQSDLHYLQVRTTRGRATVLASIAAAEAALAADGMRVHRSHWVCLAHVLRVATTGRGTFLLLSDGGRVPVSRRRVSQVRARLGRGFLVDPP